MFRRRKIAYEIAVAFSFIVIGSISTLTFTISKINTDSLRLYAREYAIAVADGIKENITSKIVDLETSYNTAINLLNDPYLSTDQKIDYLRMLVFSQEIDYIAIYDKNGELTDAISRRDFQVPEKIIIESKKIDEYQKADDKLHFDIHLPNKEDFGILYGIGKLILNNRMIGYIAVGLGLKQLSENLQNISFRKFGVPDLIFIIDENGRILVHPKLDLIGRKISDIEVENKTDFQLITKKDLSLSAEQLDYEKRMVFRTYISFPKFHWAIVVSQLSDSIYSELRKLYKISILIGFFFIVFALILAILSSKYLVKPIEKLNEGIKRVAEKDFGIKVHISTKNEIGELAKSFNYMIEKINEYREEIRKEAEMRAYLQRYIPTHFVIKITEEGEVRRILERSEFRELSILFADIVDFTYSTQKLGSEKIALLLNKFFSLATQCIFRYDGVIDKFIGDCIMALFGVFDEPEFSQRSILSAIEIMNSLRSKKAEFEREFGIGIDIRVGIATGRVLVGPIGSDVRADYTAIGEAVNLASRLQEMASPGEILIDRKTKEKITNKNINLSPIGSIRIKGIPEPVEVFRIVF